MRVKGKQTRSNSQVFIFLANIVVGWSCGMIVVRINDNCVLLLVLFLYTHRTSTLNYYKFYTKATSI